METHLLISIAAIAILLLCSAFFSGSETCLTAASRARMHTLEQQGDRRAALVNLLFARKENLIGTILLGNNLVNILASALATSVLIGFFGEAGVAYATLGMTLLVLIFAEVLPKTYAIHNADRMALVVAPVMKPIVMVLTPVTRAVQFVVQGSLRLVGVKALGGLSADQSEEELRGVIDLHGGAGQEVKHERQMLRSILDLADVWVEEIMTHRSNMVSVNADDPPAKIVKEILSSPYTRFPLWRQDNDNIIGVLHAKALLRAVQAAGGRVDDLDLPAIAADPWFIPDTTDLLSQLHAFRSRHEHFAIVVDEYGELLGIVTLEDILEEIVGEIEDEHDVEVEGVTQQPDGSCIVEGSVTIRDLNRMFEWRLPDDEASTLAGLILYEARRIPEVGQIFVHHGFRFEILGRQRNQITSVKVTVLEPAEPADQEHARDGAENSSGPPG